MHIAAQRGNVDILRAAIEHRPDVNHVTTNQLYTPSFVHVAASFHRSEAINVLVEAGVIIDARDTYDATPLH